jgi:ABC-type nitrate/sulfonate/bicarbonate transport system substrate-binding protein
MFKFKSICLRSVAILTLLAIFDSFAQAKNEINVGVAGPAINLIYTYIAQDAGLWKKYGLDTRVMMFESGSTLAQVARTGEIKFAINSGPATVASRAQGADTIIVAAAVNKLPYVMVTSKAITRWADLRGKKVGISRFGSGTDTAISLLCRKFGLDPAKDIVIFQGGTQPSRLQAVSAGVLDATLVSPGLDLVAKKQGLNILTNVAELDILYPQLVIESTDRFNRENPQIVKGFLKGFIEAMRYSATHKDETKKAITRYLKTSDSEIVEATYRSFIPVTDYNASPNLEGIRNTIDEVGQRVPAARSKMPQAFVDLRFLKELEREGFFQAVE